MTQNKLKRIHFVHSITLAVLIVILGILLITSCLDIYYSSDRDPYSPDSIAQRFDRISSVVYITIVGIVGGLALDVIFPLERKRPKAVAQERVLLARLRARVLSAENENRMLLEKNLWRRKVWRCIFLIIPCVVFILLMIYPTYYLSDPDHFTVTNLNADIIKAVLIVIIPALLGLVCFFIFYLLIRRSIRNEAKFCKHVLSGSSGKTAPNISDKNHKKKWLPWFIRGCLLLLAASFILVGIINGGANDVLKKAIAICTECIGLG